MKHTTDYTKLFNPASIAVIGASTDKFKGGGRFLNDFLHHGYKGTLYPVNQKEKEIMGLKCYSSVLNIPGRVDLAYIAVPSLAVQGVLAECSKKGVEFAVIHSAGFSEIGADGKELEKKLTAAISGGKPRIIGPNCMGIYSPSARINTVTADDYKDDTEGPVSFAAQSGWVPHNVLQLGHIQGIRFNAALSIGNQADIQIEDLLEFFGDNPDTKVPSFYIEGLKRSRDFMRIAKEVSRKKPVVVWKGGRSQIGSRAVASHTGSLAGNNVIFDSAMKQSGVTVAYNIEELLDYMSVFICPYLPKGNRIGVLAESGGGGVAVADAASEYDLEIPTLSEERQKELFERLKGTIPPFSMPKNPVDLVWPPMKNRIELLIDCAEIILKEVDAIIILDYAVFKKKYVTEMVALRDRTKKPVLLAPCFPGRRMKDLEKLTMNGIPSFVIPERAVKALNGMVKYSEYRRSVEQ